MMYAETVLLIQNARKGPHDPHSSANAHDHRLFLLLSTGLLCLITVYLFAQNFFGEEMWIINEGYSGGSQQYYANHAAVWYQTMGSASSIVMNWMSDGYLVSRMRESSCCGLSPRSSFVGADRCWLSLLPDISYLCHLERQDARCHCSGGTLRRNRRCVSQHVPARPVALNGICF